MNTEREDIWVGGVEAGGTKFLCGVGCGPSDVAQPQNRIEFPTGNDPGRLMTEVTSWFKAQEAIHGHRLRAIGIVSFGPVDPRSGSPTYGYITSTPKPGWRNINLAGGISREFPGIPVGFDTDVNGGALGEYFWGSAQGLSDFVYITMGTGIGAGGMAGGRLLHGLLHPEMGHMRIPRLAGDAFHGICPFHGDCWEGLCSGEAIQARTGRPAQDLPPDHPVWPLQARYTALAIANIICVLSPRRIIIGGSVRKAGNFGERAFFHAVCENVRTVLHDCIDVSSLKDNSIHDYIAPPKLGDDAGLCGAIALGRLECKKG